MTQAQAATVSRLQAQGYVVLFDGSDRPGAPVHMKAPDGKKYAVLPDGSVRAE